MSVCSSFNCPFVSSGFLPFAFFFLPICLAGCVLESFASLDCRAFALLDKKLKKNFVQARFFFIFLLVLPIYPAVHVKESFASLDCRAFALLDKKLKKNFVQAQFFFIFLSSTAHCLRTLYHMPCVAFPRIRSFEETSK